jgi:hypothetical protein
VHPVVATNAQPNQIRLVVDPASPTPNVVGMFRLGSAQFTARVTLGVFGNVHLLSLYL